MDLHLIVLPNYWYIYMWLSTINWKKVGIIEYLWSISLHLEVLPNGLSLILFRDNERQDNFRLTSTAILETPSFFLWIVVNKFNWNLTASSGHWLNLIRSWADAFESTRVWMWSNESKQGLNGCYWKWTRPNQPLSILIMLEWMKKCLIWLDWC